MSSPRILCVQVAALGGQGGGVLVDWLVKAARLAGYPAQATSIPGVAQRTGATTYYFELYPEIDPPKYPVFSLFPDIGDLDMSVALELSEAGRALEKGLIGDETTVITSRARMYSTAEKMVAADGTIPAEPIVDALRCVAKSVVLLDMAELAKSAGGMANAAILGAMCASGILPLTADQFREAIRASGVAVEKNLAGFEAGLTATPLATAEDGIRNVFEPAPEHFKRAVSEMPPALQPLVGHALSRLTAYQDMRYAQLFVDRLAPFIAADDSENKRLASEVARRLAAWMGFEDVIRVAQLKTRPGRFARIREDLGLQDDAPLRVTDYLKPGREEIAAVLPPSLARMVVKPNGASSGYPLRINTAGPFGFALMKVLAAMKPLRRRSSGFQHEQAAIEKWLNAVQAAMDVDNDLALRLAEAAICARGYGRVRRRGSERLSALLEGIGARLSSDRDGLSDEIDRVLTWARTDPDCAAPN